MHPRPEFFPGCSPRRAARAAGARLPRLSPDRAKALALTSRESERIGPQADRLLRVMVLTREPVKDYSLDSLKSINRGKGAPLKIRMRIVAEKNWEPIAA